MVQQVLVCPAPTHHRPHPPTTFSELLPAHVLMCIGKRMRLVMSHITVKVVYLLYKDTDLVKLETILRLAAENIDIEICVEYGFPII